MIPEELTRFRENPSLLQQRLDWALELEKTTPEKLLLNHFKIWEPHGSEAILFTSVEELEQINPIPAQYNSYKSLQKNSIILAVISFVVLLIACVIPRDRPLVVTLLVATVVFIAAAVLFRVRRISVGSVNVGGKTVRRESKMIQLGGFFHLSQFRIVTDFNRNEKMICPTCKGAGAYEASCNSCGGSGTHTYKQQVWEGQGTIEREMQETCPNCGGSGRAIYTCGYCGGKGDFGTAGEWADRYNAAASKINIQLDEIIGRNKDKVTEFNHLVESTDNKIKVWNSKIVAAPAAEVSPQATNSQFEPNSQKSETDRVVCPHCRESIDPAALLANRLKCPQCGKQAVDCNYHENGAVAYCPNCGIYLCETCINTRNGHNYCNKCRSEVQT